MKLVIIEKNRKRINKLFEWFIYMLGYTLVFVLATSIFDTVEVSGNYLIDFLIVLVIYALNKTVKPVLVQLTIPITGITLGLFYPCINLFILKIVDWIMKGYFDINNLFIAFFLAILLSIMNFIVEEIIKSILKKVKVHE